MGKVLVLIKWNMDSRGWAAIDVRLFYMFDFNHEPVVVYITNINKDSFLYTIRRCDNGLHEPTISLTGLLLQMNKAKSSLTWQ